MEELKLNWMHSCGEELRTGPLSCIMQAVIIDDEFAVDEQLRTIIGIRIELVISFLKDAQTTAVSESEEVIPISSIEIKVQ